MRNRKGFLLSPEDGRNLHPIHRCVSMDVLRKVRLSRALVPGAALKADLFNPCACAPTLFSSQVLILPWNILEQPSGSPLGSPHLRR